MKFGASYDPSHPAGQHTAEIMEDTASAISAHGPPVVLIVIGLLALILAFKVGKFILKLVFGVLALVLILGAVWWFVQGR